MPYRLSGGEQQSLAIARSLLNDPEVIIADEPTGNLDPETTNDVMMLLTKSTKKENNTHGDTQLQSDSQVPITYHSLCGWQSH